MLQRAFRYETLLRIRKRQEDLRAAALAVARRNVHNAEEQRARLSEEQRVTLERAKDLARDEFDASDVRRYYQYERHLAQLAVAKDAEIRSLTVVAESRRAELEDATKRKRIVEKLKEHQNAAYEKHVLKQEQRLTDEVATNYAAMGATAPNTTSMAGQGRGNR
jgi:flagellar export protein FliJ